MMNKIITSITALSVAVSACTTGVTPAFAESTKSTIRVVHAIPDAPAVDIYVDDKKTLSSLNYKKVTGYVSLESGKHTIKIYPTSAQGKGTPVAQQDVDLNANWDYTVAATGKLNSPQIRIFSDNLNLPGSGKTNIRVYHLSSNAPAINLAVKDGNILARNLAYGNATEYLQVESKNYQLQIQNAANNEVIYTTSATLASNSVQSIFAFGLINETPAFSTLITVDRRGAGTPATGVERSYAFMTLAATMIAGVGIALKKIAQIQENI